MEFHTNTANIRSDLMRPSQAAVAGAGRRYKAIVVVFLGGGSDSYNLIVPHSNCVGKDYYAEYASVRTGAAIAKTSLLPINVPAGTQPCDTFGVHPAMGNITGMYTLGEAAFLTNIGALVEPVTKVGDQRFRACGWFTHSWPKKNKTHRPTLRARRACGRPFLPLSLPMT